MSKPSLVNEAVSLLRAAGVEDIRTRRGAKHIRLAYSVRGQDLVTFVSISPSDWRARRNVMAQLRRTLRGPEDGSP